MAKESRHAARVGFDAGTRINLLETDMDNLESSLGGVKDELRRMSRRLTGVMISLSTASVLLAANIVFSNGAG